MAAKVGTKGQMVIAKEIRDRLGVKPGWLALQRLVDDHLEVYFIPPEHNRSLKGVLAPYIHTTLLDTEEAWDKAREAAWADAVRGEFDDEDTAEGGSCLLAVATRQRRQS